MRAWMLILLVLVQPLALVSCGDSAAERAQMRAQEDSARELALAQSRLLEAAHTIVLDSTQSELELIQYTIGDGCWRNYSSAERALTIDWLTLEYRDAVGPRINLRPQELTPDGFEPLRQLILRTIAQVR